MDHLFIVVLKILAVVVLLLLNGFFVAAEFALVKVRHTQLDPLIRTGSRRARTARHIIDNLDRYLSAAQLGITLTSLGLGWVGEPVFLVLLQPLMEWLQVTSEEARERVAFLVGFTALTFLHITAGEQAPKWLAIQKPLPTTLWIAQPLAWFCTLAYPFIWVLNQSSLWLLRRIGIEPKGEAGLHSEEELRLLFVAAQERAGATALGREIVINALDLHRRIAREVMRPRHEIVCLDTEASIAHCIHVAERTRFSRLPLCEGGDLDRTLGVVHIKDLYPMRLKARRARDLAPAAKKIVFVPETSRLEKVLQLLLERQLHLAFVVDEFGGTVGMVTLENVIEELVGQIQDEFDQETPLRRQTADGTWELLGALPIHELAELVGEPIEAEEVTTTSGWVTKRLGGFPRVGDALEVGAYRLTVEEMDGPLVSRLKLQHLTEQPSPG